MHVRKTLDQGTKDSYHYNIRFPNTDNVHYTSTKLSCKNKFSSFIKGLFQVLQRSVIKISSSLASYQRSWENSYLNLTKTNPKCSKVFWIFFYPISVELPLSAQLTGRHEERFASAINKIQKYEEGGAFEDGQCAVPLLKVTELNAKIIQHSKVVHGFLQISGKWFHFCHYFWNKLYIVQTNVIGKN